jgi:hypothetical protein
MKMGNNEEFVKAWMNRFEMFDLDELKMIDAALRVVMMEKPQ